VKVVGRNKNINAWQHILNPVRFNGESVDSMYET